MERHEHIIDLIKDFKVGAEIGVRRGELSELLLAKWPGKLYMVDIWRHIPGWVDMSNVDNNGQLDNMAHTFMAVYKFGDRACIIRDTSIATSKLFVDGSLDFVYIDAGHDKKSVTEDLNAWYPKVREGGLIIGDDYYDALFHLKDVPNSNTLVEVKTAVDEFAKKNNKEVNVTKEHKQWWIEK